MYLIELVISKTKDDSGRLSEADDYQPAIDAALERYSGHRPRELVRDVAGNGTHDLDLPEDWVAEFSRVLRVEYPVGDVPESWLLRNEWRLYASPSGIKLRLPDLAPEATDSVRVTFTAPRTDEQIHHGDTDAVACLAASFCCETLANLFAQTNDPTISADVVNYRSKSAEFAARAKRLRGLYFDHMGIDAEGGAPAAMVTAPAKGSGSGLTHWRP